MYGRNRRAIGANPVPGGETYPMSLDNATVARIAHLARIKLPAEELEPMAAELNAILSWVEQLAELDTENVPPMTGVEHEGLRRRADVIDDGGNAGAVLANAPESVGGFYVVPKVVE